MRQAWTLAGSVAARQAGVLIAVALLLVAASAVVRAEDASVAFLGLGKLFGLEDDDKDGGIEEPPQADGIDYTVDIKGVDDNSGLKSTLEKSALLNSLKDKPPPIRAGLVRRIEGDVERFNTVLRSEGYYSGDVAYDLNTEKTPAQITITVTSGPPYTLASYDMRYAESGDAGAAAGAPQVPPLEDLGLAIGDQARGAAIVAAEGRAIDRLQDEAHPFAKQVDRRVVVDHGAKTVAVDVVIDPGPRAAFGTTSVEGLERVEEDYVRQWIPWKEGEPYSERKVADLRSDLVKTGLFDSVAIDYPQQLNAAGELDATLQVQEGKPRSIGFGVGYSTDRGPGAKVFWRHRNLLGRDEDLEVSLGGDPLQQEGSISFVRPNLGREDRNFFAEALFRNNATDAFDGLEANATSGLEWPLSERWSASLAGSIDYSDLTDNDDRTESLLFGVPASVRYQGSDDEFNPTEGINLDLAVTPYTGTSSEKSLLFNVAEGTVRGYYPIDADRRYVLAGRLRLGSIVGEETEDIPANKRLYAGGGGSVRGYAFQTVGPLDADDDPVGGRSKLVFSAELRARVWGDIGVVPFVDGGNVYDSVLPDFSDPVLWAAGLGLRYYTGVGPLRFDVAFPINRRDGVDDSFQFYFSIGQAF
ncbi:MAG: outer membrane protein assembly factor [Rhodospirillales bacterium]|nr:outer membrane protein assembly factor [Rhodospirillales bacterium]